MPIIIDLDEKIVCFANDEGKTTYILGGNTDK